MVRRKYASCVEVSFLVSVEVVVVFRFACVVLESGLPSGSMGGCNAEVGRLFCWRTEAEVRRLSAMLVDREGGIEAMRRHDHCSQDPVGTRVVATFGLVDWSWVEV